MNPAGLSTLVSGLFPPGAVAAELHGPGDPSLLFRAELELLGRAVPKRVGEFAAGRLCARRALQELGIVDFPLRVGDDRQPVWPQSLVGSITHTTDFCAAVVAERRRVHALGLDSEVVGDVNVEIWPRICVPEELAWIASLPEGEQRAAVTLIFSAKEAFYKCQYSLVGDRLGFQDARVAPAGWNLERGDIHIHATRAIALPSADVQALQGRYVFHEGRLTAGIALVSTPCRREIP
ncbi:MAG TPA: 4'-phosphopantetheinyl transferase superfamily protein [Steroidobacteraceae bacterium]|nr:4'-phosphopantetheinyl transferase superfamily protein [Steroidobacteraceae bacterium]